MMIAEAKIPCRAQPRERLSLRNSLKSSDPAELKAFGNKDNGMLAEPTTAPISMAIIIRFAFIILRLS